jgi:membrane-associated phospholipid phosphatase
MTTGVLRMAFGGHFFTDIAAAGIVAFLVVWLMYALIYRWPRTRLSDEAIDTALTKAAWPLHRLRQRWRGREAGPASSL